MPCLTSSTSSCRWPPRTTSTASAGRPGPGWTATRYRSSASTSRSCCGRSRRSCGPRSRSRSSRASRPTDRSGPSRSCCARPPGLQGGRVSPAEAVSVEPLPVEGRLGVGSRPPAGQTSGRPIRVPPGSSSRTRPGRARSIPGPASARGIPPRVRVSRIRPRQGAAATRRRGVSAPDNRVVRASRSAPSTRRGAGRAGVRVDVPAARVSPDRVRVRSTRCRVSDSRDTATSGPMATVDDARTIATADQRRW